MDARNFIWEYVSSCISGKLGFSECGPIWQLFLIGVFLLLAVVALLSLKLRSRAPSGQR